MMSARDMKALIKAKVKRKAGTATLYTASLYTARIGRLRAAGRLK